MSYLSVAEALVASLVCEGVEVIFGIPGVQITDATDAIYRDTNIRWISPRHEQTAAYMAYGYACTTDKTGVALVLPGPGALNTTAAIGTAYSVAVPVLLISGQIASYAIITRLALVLPIDSLIFSRFSGRQRKSISSTCTTPARF